QIGGEFFAAINITANNRAPVGMRIIQHRPATDTDVSRWHFAQCPFTVIPLEIQPGLAGLDYIHLFTRAFTDVADENPARDRVISHAVRTAQSEAKEFFKHVRLADER